MWHRGGRTLSGRRLGTEEMDPATAALLGTKTAGLVGSRNPVLGSERPTDGGELASRKHRSAEAEPNADSAPPSAGASRRLRWERTRSIVEVSLMSATEEKLDQPSAPELLAVADAAGARLRAETDEDSDAAGAATEALVTATASAMRAGHSLTEIARAEARGKEDVRREFGRDALKRVERSARQARDAQAEHHRMIARALRLGLSTRDIASAAGVTHGTIRAISIRLSEDAPSSDQPVVD